LPLTRRRFLIGSAALTAGAALLACSETPQPTPPAEVTPRPTLTPTASPAPTPAATPSGLSLRQRIAQLLIVGFRGRELAADDPILADIRDLGLGGVILFGRNISSPAQLATLTATLRAAAGDRPLLIATDQEGGQVARLSPQNGFDALPSAAALGRSGSVTQAAAAGRQIGSMLSSAGINLNLAPVVDLDVNPDNPSIGALDRSFSADPQVVIEMAEAQIDAQHAARPAVLTTLKHFPGLGSATGNTDLAFVDITQTWTRRELQPFRRIVADGLADVVMVANALNGQIDPDLPASLSPATLTVLRDELAFDGPAITDDLGAGALRARYSDDDILRLALLAGNDLLLLANSSQPVGGVAGAAVDTIAGLVESGAIPVARIDEAFGRVQSLLRRA
jgi:beta-N-acetylhexosaminidase